MDHAAFGYAITGLRPLTPLSVTAAAAGPGSHMADQEGPPPVPADLHDLSRAVPGHITAPTAQHVPPGPPISVVADPRRQTPLVPAAAGPELTQPGSSHTTNWPPPAAACPHPTTVGTPPGPGHYLPVEPRPAAVPVNLHGYGYQPTAPRNDVNQQAPVIGHRHAYMAPNHAAGPTQRATGHTAITGPAWQCGTDQTPAGPRPQTPPVAAEYRAPRDAAATGETAPAAVEKTAREHGIQVDRARDHSLVPLVSYAAPPAPGLRLAGVSTGAAQELRHRSRYVAVTASLSQAEPPPATTTEYMARVAELAAHRAYHFPAVGPQLTAYLAWLLRTYGHRPLCDAQAADSKAREAMAASPRVLHTALDWELLCRPSEQPRQTADARQPRGAVVCNNFLKGRCPNTPCPWRRLHPACRVCQRGDHPTELHAEAGRGEAGPPTDARQQRYQPYPARGRGYRR